MLLPTLLGLSLLTFALLRLIPGDPAQVMLGEHASAEQVARYRAEMGLDHPLPIQYLRYLGKLVQGNWGRSLKTNLPVWTELGQRLPASVELGLAALALACLAGIPLGVLAAHRPGSWIEVAAGGGMLLGASVPLFWLGLLLAHMFGYRLGWLPPSGRLSIDVEGLSQAGLLYSSFTGNWAGLADGLQHLILPALTLSIAPLAVVVRLTRTCLREALAGDYVRTARAKGLPERAVLLTHALGNAGLPIVTAIGSQAGLLFSGAILTETVFSWPGLGQLVVDRILARDYPVVQGIVLVTALMIVLINLTTDVLYAYLDPRIRYE